MRWGFILLWLSINRQTHRCNNLYASPLRDRQLVQLFRIVLLLLVLGLHTFVDQPQEEVEEHHGSCKQDEDVRVVAMQCVLRPWVERVVEQSHEE